MDISRIRKPGCHACKAKRVKCDREVPYCQKCRKTGKTCPGYPDTDHFRDMGKYAEIEVKKRVRDRLKDPGSSVCSVSMINQIGAIETLSLSGALSRNISPSSLPCQIGTNWEEVAIPRFYADYIFRSDPMRFSTFKFIPDIVSKNRSCSILNDSLRAVALVNLANQTHQESLAVEAKRSFYRAVRCMAMLLQDPSEARRDTTLVTSFLFGIFYVINGYDVTQSWSTFHQQGRTALLKLRGEGNLKTKTSHNIWGSIWVVHMAKCITSHIRPPDEAERWLELAKWNDPMYDLSVTVFRHARLGAKAQALFDEQTQNEWWVIELLKIVKESIQIDEGYQVWEDSMDGVWRYKETRSSTGPNQHIYQDIMTAALWNRNRGFRIHLHEVLLRCCSLIQSHPYGQTLPFDFESTRKQSTSIIADMISDIIASIAYCLGSIDSKGSTLDPARSLPISGYFTMFPLYLAMVSAGEGSETQSWLRRKLLYISDALGVRLAGNLARRQKRDPWDIR